MATWAYECRSCECRSCEDDDTVWFVAREAIAEMPHDVRMLRVKVGDEWLCATVDRDRLVSVEGLLVRETVASDPADCPECVQRLSPRPPEMFTPLDQPASAEPAASRKPERKVLAAAISMQGIRFVVVLVSHALADSPGEADLLIADLQPRFGDVPIVLMGQYEDGTSTWYGDRNLIDLLANVPLDRMPWKEYPIG